MFNIIVLITESQCHVCTILLKIETILSDRVVATSNIRKFCQRKKAALRFLVNLGVDSICKNSLLLAANVAFYNVSISYKSEAVAYRAIASHSEIRDEDVSSSD